VQLACDRAVVIYGGRVMAEMPAEVADEPALMRAAHGLLSGVERSRTSGGVAGTEASA
jgi:ribose transport system ATP-binding protein